MRPSLPPAALAAPPPPPGLSAWTEGAAPGPARLPWLPDDLGRVPGETVLFVGMLGVVSIILLAGPTVWWRLLGVAMLLSAAWLAWTDRRQRAAKRARSFVAIDAARSIVQAAEAATGLDIAVPVATIDAVGVLVDVAGNHVILRRTGLPDVMVSGALPPAAAEAAAAALALRLALPCEGAAAVPPPPVARAPIPVGPAPDPPHGESVMVGPNAAAAGRQALWLGGFVAVCGLPFLFMSGMPGLMRWGLGLGLLAAGLAITRLRARWEANARAPIAVIDRAAGTVTLLRLPRGTDQVAPLAAVRRVVVLTGGEDVWAAIDFLDRPRLALPLSGTLDDVEAMAGDLAAALGCPIEHAS